MKEAILMSENKIDRRAMKTRKAIFEALAELLALEFEAVAVVLITEVNRVLERGPPDEVADAYIRVTHVLRGELLQHGNPFRRYTEKIAERGQF